MGLGKTVQLIGLILADVAGEDDEHGPTLVVCPASVLGNWEHELARFAPGLRVARHHGVDRAHGATDLLECDEGGAPDVVVTSYGTATLDADLLTTIHWRRVALDEAQNVKNAETHRYRAVRQFAADQRLALTGTPVENRVEEFWALLEFVNPGLLGGRAAFRRQFAEPIESGETDAAERLRRLAGPFVLRRTKSDPAIAVELPEKQEFKVYCSLTAGQAALYQAAVDDAMADIAGAEGMTRRGRVLALITRLKQLADHPALLDEAGGDAHEARGATQRAEDEADRAGNGAGPRDQGGEPARQAGEDSKAAGVDAKDGDNAGTKVHVDVQRSGKMTRLLEMLEEVADARERPMSATRPPGTGPVKVRDTLDSEAEYYDAPQSPPPLHFEIAPPERPAAMLDRLGPAPSWSVPARLREFLVAALDAGARVAFSLSPGHGPRARPVSRAASVAQTAGPLHHIAPRGVTRVYLPPPREAD